MEANEDDEEVCLSDYAAKALQEFYNERAAKEAISGNKGAEDVYVDENWELSQFWYDEDTATTLANVAVRAAGENNRIACVSSPTVFRQIWKTKSNVEGCVLFEYDLRFQSLFPDHFEFYDYNNSLDIRNDLKSSFSVVIADPPYLSRECLEKVLQTVKLLTDDKVILCTGAIMQEDAQELFGLQMCNFKPKHQNNLGNEFRCYANFDVDGYISNIAAT